LIEAHRDYARGKSSPWEPWIRKQRWILMHNHWANRVEMEEAQALGHIENRRTTGRKGKSTKHTRRNPYSGKLAVLIRAPMNSKRFWTRAE